MMPGRRAPALVLAALLACGAVPAVAATSDVTPTGFLVTVRHEVRAGSARLWTALGEIDKWWNPSHSYSGVAVNLSLARYAGGCFCERWNAHSIEHARVVLALENRMLRLQGALGPLQALAASGVLTFELTAKDGGTALLVTYRVAGNEAAGLPALAGPVDNVIAEQMRRLAAYVDTGRPD